MKRIFVAFWLVAVLSTALFAQNGRPEVLRLKQNVVLENAKDRVRIALFSPDDKKLLLINRKSVQLRAVETGALLHAFPADKFKRNDALNIKWQPHGAKVVVYNNNDSTLLGIGVGNISRSAFIWDTNTGDVVGVLANEKKPISQVEWSRDGKMILTSGSYYNFALWNENGALLKSFADSPKTVVEFSPDQKMLLVYQNSDGFRRGAQPLFWDIEKAAFVEPPQATKEPPPELGAFVLAKSSDGKLICGYDKTESFACWKKNSEQTFERRFVNNKISGDAQFIGFHPDSKSFAVRRLRSATIEVIDAETGAVKTALPSSEEYKIAEYLPDPANRFIPYLITPNGKLILVQDTCETRVYDAATKNQISSFGLQCSDPYPNQSGAFGAAPMILNREKLFVNPNPNLNVVMSFNGEFVRLWHPETATLMREFGETHLNRERANHNDIARWSNDGNLLMTAARENKGVNLWQVLPITNFVR